MKKNKLIKEIGKIKFFTVRLEKRHLEKCLKSYLKKKFGLVIDFEISCKRYDDISDVTVEFDDDELNNDFFNENVNDNGRLLLAEAIADELSLEPENVAVFPEEHSVEYILVELPVGVLLKMHI